MRLRKLHANHKEELLVERKKVTEKEHEIRQLKKEKEDEIRELKKELNTELLKLIKKKNKQRNKAHKIGSQDNLTNSLTKSNLDKYFDL